MFGYRVNGFGRRRVVAASAPISDGYFTLLETISGQIGLNVWQSKSYSVSDGLVAGETGRLLIHMMASISWKSDMQVDNFNIDGQQHTFGSTASSFTRTSLAQQQNTFLSTMTPASRLSTYNAKTFETVTTGTSGESLWLRDSFGTGSSGTGSTVDGSGNSSGHYLYFEASGNGWPFGGILRGPEVTLGSSPTISFLTSRYGSEMGNAEVWWKKS